MSDRDDLARAIYELQPYHSNVGPDGKMLPYSYPKPFDTVQRYHDSFYALADGLLAAGYRKVAPAVPFDAPPIEGPWDN